MKFLGILLFVAVSQAFVVEDVRVKRSVELTTPYFTKLTVQDPSDQNKIKKVVDVKLEWTPVTSDNPQDPVLGYKLKVWEIPYTTVVKVIDGEVKIGTERSTISYEKNPTTEPQDYVTDKTNYILKDLPVGSEYEFRVQAYSKTKESGLSAPFGLSILPSNKDSRE